MNKLVDEITEYMDFLKNRLHLCISVHFTDEELMKMPDSVFSKLLPYNTHDNPYCEYVKKNGWRQCVADQQKIFLDAGSEESRCVKCHAGVKEEVFYIRKGMETAGFVAVSGCRDQTAEKDCKNPSLWENALSPSPLPDFCHSAVIPLCRMFELLFMNPMAAEDSGEIRLILNYINQNHGIVTLDGLCEQFGRSQSYISHMFHEKCGETLPEYCTNLKLRYAREQLLRGDVSVTEAAMNSGFANPSYFIMCFRNKYGITPLRLKKGNLQNGKH